MHIIIARMNNIYNKIYNTGFNSNLGFRDSLTCVNVLRLSLFFLTAKQNGSIIRKFVWLKVI